MKAYLDLLRHVRQHGEIRADRTGTGTRGIFGATYVLAEKLNLGYTFTDQTNQDNVANRTQEQRSHVASANYKIGRAHV